MNIFVHHFFWGGKKTAQNNQQPNNEENLQTSEYMYYIGNMWGTSSSNN